MTKVLYLSYDGMTDPLGQSQVLPYLVGLSKEGYSFTLISFEKKERYNQEKQVIELICSSNNIDWKPLFYTKRPPILSTIKDVIKMNVLSIKLHKQKQFSIVHARGSYMTSIVGLKLKMKFGIKYIFDMRGFWADERVEGGLWNLKKFHYKLIYIYFKRKEKQFLKSADAIVTLTFKAKDIIHDWNIVPGDSMKKITVIPCCADLDLFDFNKYSIEDKTNSRIKLGLNLQATVFCYLGSIGTWYMLDEMLDFFKIFSSKEKSSVLLFITNENEENIRLNASKHSIPQDLITIVKASRNQVAEYLLSADYSLFFIRPTFSKNGSSPVKHGESLGMGLPIITNYGVGDMDLITNPNENGLQIDLSKMDENLELNEILKLKSLKKSTIRSSAFNYYDLKKGILAYKEIYNQITTDEIH